MTATVIHRIGNGRLAEQWSDKDLLGLLQQLGGIPALGGMPEQSGRHQDLGPGERDPG
jgi:hypothetical protein